MHIKLGIIDVKNGMKYRTEFIRSAIDITKLFSGGGMLSFLGKTVINGLAEAADFELKFPLKKVKSYPKILEKSNLFPAESLQHQQLHDH